MIGFGVKGYCGRCGWPIWTSYGSLDSLLVWIVRINCLEDYTKCHIVIKIAEN